MNISKIIMNQFITKRTTTVRASGFPTARMKVMTTGFTTDLRKDTAKDIPMVIAMAITKKKRLSRVGIPTDTKMVIATDLQMQPAIDWGLL